MRRSSVTGVNVGCDRARLNDVLVFVAVPVDGRPRRRPFRLCPNVSGCGFISRVLDFVFRLSRVSCLESRIPRSRHFTSFTLGVSVCVCVRVGHRPPCLFDGENIDLNGAAQSVMVRI